MPTPKSTPDHDDFMNLVDAAKDIGCGVRWLRDGANHGGFPHDRYGKTMWFSRQQRDQIRQLCRQPAQPGLMNRYVQRQKPRLKTAA